jgi:hypothetical protein
MNTFNTFLESGALYITKRPLEVFDEKYKRYTVPAGTNVMILSLKQINFYLVTVDYLIEKQKYHHRWNSVDIKLCLQKL